MASKWPLSNEATRFEGDSEFMSLPTPMNAPHAAQYRHELAVAVRAVIAKMAFLPHG